jgi:xanthine dehydrogenase accessory factor
MYDEFYAKAHELTQKGEPFVTATVVRAEKPTSGKPGDKAIVTADGVMYGWIGGNCAQPTVIKEGLRALAADESRLIRLSAEPDKQTPREGLLDLPMTCFSGGTLEIFIEPQYARPRLLIVGDLPVARALAHLGKAMNYHVIAVDPDGQGESMPHADEVLTDLDKTISQIQQFTYVIVATHGSYDELALEKILPANPTYVGLVASPKRAEAVRQYLVGQGISETEMLPLKAPAGLDIQARRGDEIALSIMAEIVQKRRSAEELDLALFHSQAADTEEADDIAAEEKGMHEETTVKIPVLNRRVKTAVDPICHMTVDIDTAKYTSEYEGVTYYFCCAGCKQTFEKNPSSYVGEKSAGSA